MFFYSDEVFRLRDIYTEYDAVLGIRPVHESQYHDNDEQRLLIGLRYSLELTGCDGRRGWGSLQLRRSFNTRPFSEREQCIVAQFSRHIAHALTAPRTNITQFSARGHSELVIVDENGNIDLASDNALRILSLADGGMPSPSQATRVPVWLMALVANVARRWPGAPTQPSAMVRRTGAGEFVFKLYALDASSEPDSHAAIAVHMLHYPPLQLQVELTGYELGLSERQRQLCVDLLAGYGIARIAQRMGVKASTVVDHERETYRKLGVHSRHELARCFGEAPDNV
ncbi:hypothetical protein BTH42_28035 [Burkholderia sp. SRS-W-2-2016]|nr:hypothetical protein BTH42_28035 [Burkholderia sp. SRS-W-2-2016]